MRAIFLAAALALLAAPVFAQPSTTTTSTTAVTAASGSIASGALASGSIASGACASGCFASGAISNGGDVVLGNNTDSASCSSATSLIACTRQLHTDATAAIPLNSSGSQVGAVGCDSHVFKHITTATDTLAVQGVSAKVIKVCGVLAAFSGSAAQAIFLENTASTNANCSSANTQITGSWTGNSSNPSSVGFHNALWSGLANTSANGLCINSTGTGGVDVDIWYTQGS